MEHQSPDSSDIDILSGIRELSKQQEEFTKLLEGLLALREKLVEHESKYLESEKRYQEHLEQMNIFRQKAEEAINRHKVFIEDIDKKFNRFKETLIKNQEELERKQIAKLDDIIKTYKLIKQKVESSEYVISEFKKEISEMENKFSKSIESLNAITTEQGDQISSLAGRANRIDRRIRKIWFFIFGVIFLPPLIWFIIRQISLHMNP